MEKLNYSDCVFIEQCLTYYSLNGVREMKKYPSVYSEQDILKFRLSVQEVTNKIIKLEKGEENNGIFSNWKRAFRLCK